MTNSSLLNRIPYIKGALILLIVLYHSMLTWAGVWNFSFLAGLEIFPIKVLADWLNSFHIYAFTFISGYIFAFIEIDRIGGGYKSFLRFCKSKVFRLLIPYIFVSIIWVIPNEVLFKECDTITILHAFVLGENPNQLWFLLMLLGVFLLFWPARKIAIKKPLLTVIYVFILYACGLIGSNYIPNVFQIWTACQYVLFFYLGFFYYRWRDKILGKVNPLTWLFIDILLFVTYEFLQASSTLLAVTHLLNGITLRIVGCVMAVEVINSLLPDVLSKDGVFTNISTRSMGIYLFHQQVIYYSLYLFCYKLGWAPVPCILLNFIVSVTVAYLITTLLMKTKFTRLMIGEKM